MNTIVCDSLDEAIEEFKRKGFRLDMISPADNPRKALMSRESELSAGADGSTRSVETTTVDGNRSCVKLELSTPQVQPPATAGGSDWIRGRAGMEYRDLVPDRMNGEMIASHIRLTQGGEVSDYVHYHKVDFQMIRCIKGRINVVYEDQGEPFWLEPGDWVIQPPEIRHRVLECDAGSEVIEISMPAEHETWVEHDMTLPTGEIRPEREFNGQRFVRHIARKE